MKVLWWTYCASLSNNFWTYTGWVMKYQVMSNRNVLDKYYKFNKNSTKFEGRLKWSSHVILDFSKIYLFSMCLTFKLTYNKCILACSASLLRAHTKFLNTVFELHIRQSAECIYYKNPSSSAKIITYILQIGGYDLKLI
jgi:hypothetical protein